MNCPIWLPIESNISIKSGSSLRTCRLENSITPATCSPTRIGNANEACNPSAIANGTARKILHLRQIRQPHRLRRFPHMPRHSDGPLVSGFPRGFDELRKAQTRRDATFSCNATRPAASSTRHSTPRSQLNPSQIAISINGAAASRDSASASTRVTAYPVESLRSASLRWVTSRATAKINFLIHARASRSTAASDKFRRRSDNDSRTKSLARLRPASRPRLRALAIVWMHKFVERFGKQFFDGYAQHLFPRRIDPLEISVEPGDAQHVQ